MGPAFCQDTWIAEGAIRCGYLLIRKGIPEHSVELSYILSVNSSPFSSERQEQHNQMVSSSCCHAPPHQEWNTSSGKFSCFPVPDITHKDFDTNDIHFSESEVSFSQCQAFLKCKCIFIQSGSCIICLSGKVESRSVLTQISCLCLFKVLHCRIL